MSFTTAEMRGDWTYGALLDLLDDLVKASYIDWGDGDDSDHSLEAINTADIIWEGLNGL